MKTNSPGLKAMWQEYTGFYYFFGFGMDVSLGENELLAAVPYVPAGYEIRLEPVEPDKFKMIGGQLSGAIAVFTRDTKGKVQGLKAGNFDLSKIPPEKVDSLETTERYLAPVLNLTPEKERGFKRLTESILEQQDGNWIEYQLPYPKHEFVQYLMEKELFIFHGSNNLEIEIFQPVRTSVELFDKDGVGNQQAVYGTHDGLWSMFFAVVARSKLKGSIRNGVAYFHNRVGEPLALYNFSINKDQLAERPYREGALYLLPRDTFTRQKFGENSYSNEWTSPKSVMPFAKLKVQPEDFPFIKQIGGHDDSLLVRIGDLGQTIRESALSASLQEDEIMIELPNTRELIELLDEYITHQQVFVPAAGFSVEEKGEKLELKINNLPPAFQQVYRETYKDFLQS